MAEVVTDTSCAQPVHLDRSKLFSNACEKCGQVILYADDATYVTSENRRIDNQRKLNLNLAKLEDFLNENE